VLWFAVLFLTSADGLQVRHADARMVVGVSTVNVAFLPIYLTQDKGFFKDEGLDVLLVMFNAGATNLQAIIGGDVQIMAGGVPETVLARPAASISKCSFSDLTKSFSMRLFSIRKGNTKGNANTFPDGIS
jgi:ABC-type nitrate/sulfonate/bicarbonate transport system substrate-binding protein